MKKRFIAFISLTIVFAMLFSFSACNGSDDSKKTEETEKDGESEKETEGKKETTKKKDADMGLAYYTNLPLESLEAGVTTTEAELKNRVYSLSSAEKNLRMIGRSRILKSGVVCDHSAAGIEFQGFMTGDVKLLASSSGDTYYTVYIDGERVEERFYANKSNVSLKIASFEGKQFHKIKVLKQSESAWSQSMLTRLEITGELIDMPKERELLIEVLGDSLTTGYGNLGVRGEGNAQGGNTPHKEDATQSYGFLTAEALNADCNIVAWSGVGLDIGWTHEPFTNYYTDYSFHRSDDEYTFGRAPDLLIIHLGANDSTNDKTSKDAFIEKGKALINLIREGYNKSDMPVIWCYDPDEGVPAYIQEILNSFGGEEKGFYLLELEWHSTDEYWGASGHPSVKAHEAHAKILTDFIKEKNIIK